MRRFHHFLEQVLDGAACIGQHAGEVIERGRAALAAPDHDAAVQDRPAQHGEGRLAPVILQAFAVGIDQHCGHVLHIRNRHHGVDAEFFQGIEGGGRAGGIRGVKAQHHLILGFAPTARERPVFALDIQNDAGAFPGQQCGQNQADTFAGARGRENHDVFRPVVPEVELHFVRFAPECPEHGRNTGVFLEPATDIDAFALKIAHGADFFFFRPAGRAVQIGVGLQFLHEGHPVGNDDELRHQEQRLAVCYSLLNETVGIAGAKLLLPGEHRPGRIPGNPPEHAPRLAKCRMIAEEGGNALGGQRQAADAEQEHKRQIEPAQAAFLFLRAQAVFCGHDILRWRPSCGAGLGLVALITPGVYSEGS